MYQKFDYFHQTDRPSLLLCNPDKKRLFSLGNAYNVDLKLNYNAASELTFNFPQSVDKGLTTLESYNSLQAKRIIEIQNFLSSGESMFFLILSTEEDLQGMVNVKTVNCQSLEIELTFKKLTLFGGTMYFYNTLNPGISMIGKIIKYLPNWSIGDIDPDLNSIGARTFDIKDKSIYDFLMNDAATSYQCVFTFDTAQRKINAIQASKVASESYKNTDIYLSFDNLLKSGKFNELTDELVTSLGVYGDGGVPITSVNPIGSPKLYNFDYFNNPNWMKESLSNKINSWEADILSNEAEYSRYLEYVSANNTASAANEALLKEAKNELNALYVEQAANIKTGAATVVGNLLGTCSFSYVNPTQNDAIVTYTFEYNPNIEYFDNKNPIKQISDYMYVGAPICFSALTKKSIPTGIKMGVVSNPAKKAGKAAKPYYVSDSPAPSQILYKTVNGISYGYFNFYIKANYSDTENVKIIGNFGKPPFRTYSKTLLEYKDLKEKIDASKQEITDLSNSINGFSANATFYLNKANEIAKKLNIEKYFIGNSTSDSAKITSSLISTGSTSPCEIYPAVSGISIGDAVIFTVDVSANNVSTGGYRNTGVCTFSIDNPCVVTKENHGFTSTGTEIYFISANQSDSFPAPILGGSYDLNNASVVNPYYISTIYDANRFTISTDSTGINAINTNSSNQSGTFYLMSDKGQLPYPLQENRTYYVAKITEDNTFTVSNYDGGAEIVTYSNATNPSPSIYGQYSYARNYWADLNEFIVENTYQNNNFVFPDRMTAANYQASLTKLRDQAKEVLKKVSQPRYEISIESSNLLALEEFKPFIDQFELGCKITINKGDSTPIKVTVLGIEYNFEDPSKFSIILSNRIRLDNGKFMYSDLFNQSVNAGTSTNFDSGKWSNWSNNYKNEVTSFISSSLDASLNNIVSSQNQDIIINQSGLRGRELVPETLNSANPEYKDKQVWLVNNMLAFTEDNWQTASLALGEITNDDTGETSFGLIAETIVGTLIAGETLTIKNQDSSFLVDANGVTIINANFSVVGAGSSNVGGVIVNPNAIFDSTTKINEPVMSVGKIVNPSATPYAMTPANTSFAVYADGTVRVGGWLATDTALVAVDANGKPIERHFIKSSAEYSPNDFYIRMGDVFGIAGDGTAYFSGVISPKKMPPPKYDPGFGDYYAGTGIVIDSSSGVGVTSYFTTPDANNTLPSINTTTGAMIEYAPPSVLTLRITGSLYTNGAWQSPDNYKLTFFGGILYDIRKA